MTQNHDSYIPDPSISQMHLLVKKLRYAKAHNWLIEEDEIRQRVEIEVAFQARLAAALDKEGYCVENIETSDVRRDASNREEHGHKSDRTLLSWRCFRVHSKDAPFWLTVWFSSDTSSLPRSFSSSKWRALGSDDMRESGPSKTKKWEGVSFNDATLPLCCHLFIVDARLGFETLPLPVMQATLLDNRLAEELASKVTLAFERIHHYEETRCNGHVVISGLPSGFPKLDIKLTGLKPAGVIVLASRPSMGKTALALSIAKCVALGRDINGCPMNGTHGRQHAVAVFSLESSTKDLATRMHCGVSGVATGHGKATVIVDDTGSLDIMELCDRTRFMKMRHKIELVIIDYLQLCKCSAFAKQGRRIEAAQISKQIKDMAKELKIPVIVLSQVCRGCEKRGDKSQKPSRSALCEACDKIVQDADAILFLSRPSRVSGLPVREDDGFISVDVVKNSNGPTGEVLLKIADLRISSGDRDVRDHNDPTSIESAPIAKASEESGEASTEIVFIEFNA